MTNQMTERSLNCLSRRICFFGLKLLPSGMEMATSGAVQMGCSLVYCTKEGEHELKICSVNMTSARSSVFLKMARLNETAYSTVFVEAFS